MRTGRWALTRGESLLSNPDQSSPKARDHKGDA